MGLRSPNAVSIGTTTGVIVALTVGTGSEDVTVIVANNGPSTCYLGAGTATVANGVPLASGGSLAISLRQGGTLAGICSSGTADIRVLVGDE